jgi:hypothetical protein
MNIWAHVSDPRPNIFVGDMLPVNATAYIRRCHITDEYIVKFVDTDK